MSVLVSSAIVFVVALGLLRLPPEQTPLLAPVVLAFGGAVVALLSLRAHERIDRSSH